MYETDINDAILQLQAGSTRAPVDLRLIALSPACTPQQYHRIASAMYAVLDEARLQTSRADKGLPLQQLSCLACLASIVPSRLLSSAAHSSLQTLAHHWSETLQWILYLKSDFVDQEDVEFSFRLLARKSIVDFLGICHQIFLRHIFDPVMASPGVIATLFSLWRAETLDKRFYLADDPSTRPKIPIPGVLDSWMCSFAQREEWDWSEILRPFGGDPEAIATTALNRLQQDLVHTPINLDLIVWDIHLLTTLSINNAICIPLLNLHSMTIVMNVINSMVGLYAITLRRSLVAKCLSFGYWYIHAYVESTEGLPWVTQVIEAGILSAVLSTEPWIKHFDGEYSESWEPMFSLLAQIIPKYSVYSSVLKPMIKQLTAIDASGLAENLDSNSFLSKSWILFERIVRNRAALYNVTLSNGTHVDSCQNPKACWSPFLRLTVSFTLLYSVASPVSPHYSEDALAASTSIIAAENVKYTIGKTAVIQDTAVTSKLVVRVSSEYLLDVEIFNIRPVVLVSRRSKHNVQFIDRLIANNVSFCRDRIRAAIVALNIDPVVVALDYTEVPMQIDIGSVQSVGAIKACKWDAALTQEWNRMVELAQKSTSSKILVRAFLAAGTSQTVKLQCLPLKWILEGDSTAADKEPDSDETYLRAGQSPGDIDIAYPGEEKAKEGRKLP